MGEGLSHPGKIENRGSKYSHELPKCKKIRISLIILSPKYLLTGIDSK